MTSKEALKKAEARTGLPIGVSCCIMTETEMRIIEKDLEVLEQYEDIEEELGIDLITLFKAYTDGFYVKGEEEKQYIDFENSLNTTAFKNKEMFYGHKWSYQYVKLYDYGKTWALTKEELENEKDKTGYIVEGTQWGSWGNDK